MGVPLPLETTAGTLGTAGRTEVGNPMIFRLPLRANRGEDGNFAANHTRALEGVGGRRDRRGTATRFSLHFFIGDFLGDVFEGEAGENDVWMRGRSARDGGRSVTDEAMFVSKNWTFMIAEWVVPSR